MKTEQAPKNIAIVIASTYGQTAKIAAFIQTKIAGLGHSATVFNLQDGPPPESLGGFDAILVGCPVYAGKFSSTLIDWVKTHTERLKSRACGFFSVSLNAADE